MLTEVVHIYIYGQKELFQEATVICTGACKYNCMQV